MGIKIFNQIYNKFYLLQSNNPNKNKKSCTVQLRWMDMTESNVMKERKKKEQFDVVFNQ